MFRNDTGVHNYFDKIAVKTMYLQKNIMNFVERLGFKLKKIQAVFSHSKNKSKSDFKFKTTVYQIGKQKFLQFKV